MKQKRSSRPELGEPVILRCQPYKIPLTELLLPHKISPVEFFRLWPSLPAVVEYTGTYIYEGSGFKATAAQQYGSSPFLGGLKSLSSKPFHRVCSHIIRTVAGFQVGISLLFEVLTIRAEFCPLELVPFSLLILYNSPQLHSILNWPVSIIFHQLELGKKPMLLFLV